MSQSKIHFTVLVSLLLIGGNVAIGQEAKEKPAAQPVVESTNAMESLLLTSKAIRAATTKIRPFLVTIESFVGSTSKKGRIGGIRKRGEGNTTGLLVSSDGFVVTSTFNFIDNPRVITVVTHDGKRRNARLRGRDDIRKICLLKIADVSDLDVPEFAKADSVRVGQWAVSVGVGYGDTTPAISSGIISAKNRVGGRAIQTDANISPANYGGPLIDIEGNVLGICVPLNPQSQAVGAGVEWYDSGIGFAIPIAPDSKVITRLRDENFKATPPFMGIKMNKVPEHKGLWIEAVVQDSPADKIGLKREDVIKKIDGVVVNDVLELRKVLNRHEGGEEIELTVWFEEKEETKTVTMVLGSPPKPQEDGPVLERPKIK